MIGYRREPGRLRSLPHRETGWGGACVSRQMTCHNDPSHHHCHPLLLTQSDEASNSRDTPDHFFNIPVEA